jgi:hypothetical protein
MKIGVTKTVEVEAKTLRIYTKVCDSFSAYLLDQDRDVIYEQDDGYVPDFMPDTHYGDYIILDIDIETGKITNWETPSVAELEDWMAADK